MPKTTEKMITWDKAQEIYYGYLDDLVTQERLDQSSVHTYKERLKTLRRSKVLSAKKYLQDLTPQDVSRFMTECKKEGKKNATINALRALLTQLFTAVAYTTRATASPLLFDTKEQIKQIRLLTKKKHNVFLETNEQWQMLLEECRSPHLHHFVFGILNTGLRPGNMLTLKAHEIDLEEGVINTIGKGRKAITVPLTAQYRAYLEEWFKKGYAKERGYLIPAPGGSHFNLTSDIGFNTACERAAKRAEAMGKPKWAEVFRSLTPHKLRHTWATRMSGKAVTEDIMSMMGQTTESVHLDYRHVMLERQRESVAAFAREMYQGVKPEVVRVREVR